MERPSHPPSTSDETIRWVQFLRNLPPRARRRQLATWAEEIDAPGTSLPPEHRPWTGLLLGLWGESEDDRMTPSAQGLLDAMRRAGVRRGRCEHYVVPLVNEPWLQEHWTDWDSIDSRGELRLRLQYLSRCDQLETDLVPFVTFFFRASDPALYRAAASALGQHLGDRPELFQYLKNYAAERSIPLDRAVRWDGKRPPRRVALALSAYRARWPTRSPAGEGVDPPPVPFTVAHEGDGKLELPSDPRDAATFLDCLRLMLRRPEPREQTEGYVRPALRRVHETAPQQRTREVVSRWGTLFVAFWECPGVDRTNLGRDWIRLRDALLDDLGPRGSFVDRFRGLTVLDEHLRTLPRLDPPTPPDLLEGAPRGRSSAERRFMRLRIRTWSRREGGDLPARTASRVSPGDAGTTGPVGELLADARRCLDAGPRSDRSVLEETRETQLAAFERLSEPLGDVRRWAGQNPSTRALRAVLILDVVLHEPLPTEPLQALLDRRGLASPEPLDASEGRGAPPGWIRVLSRLQSWESQGPESFLDAEIIHEIGDLRLLLTMLPSRRSSSILAVLADAFEHRIRVALRREDGRDLFRFLTLITVRDPHPDFFEQLERLCATRSYRDHDGTDVPLDRWIRVLRRRSRPSIGRERTDGTSGEDSNAVPARTPGDRTTRKTPFTRHLEEFRRSLRDPFGGDEAPESAVESLIDVLGVPHEGRDPAPASALGILRGLHPLGDPVLQSGTPPLRDTTLAELEETVGELTDRLRARTADLGPLDWVEPGEQDAATGAARELLEQIRELIVPSLPKPEELLLGDVIDRVDEILLEWVRRHETIADRYREALRSTTPQLGTLTDKLMGTIHDTWDSPLRHELLAAAYATLRESFVRGEKSPESRDLPAEMVFPFALEVEPRRLHRELLDGALVFLEPDTSSEFEERLVESWGRLLEQALETDDVPDVLHLLSDARYEPLRRHPNSQSLLEQARRWALDRYRVGLSLGLSRDLAVLTDTPAPSPLGELGRFLLHFSPVWLALLVGAVFMLDFGDPWKAMAENGDVGGIAATFLMGVLATFLYVFVDLRRKSTGAAGFGDWVARGKRILRSALFLGVCLLYTLTVVGMLWYLLSGTDEVVHGPFALGHIVVWTGFALFFGVFMGLLAQQT